MVDKIEDGVFNLEGQELTVADASEVPTDELLRIAEEMYAVMARVTDAMTPVTGDPIDQEELSSIDEMLSDAMKTVSGEDMPFIAVCLPTDPTFKRFATRELVPLNARFNDLVIFR